MDVYRMLADMALELEQHCTPQQVLEKISAYACIVLKADDAGILLVHSRREIETAVETSPTVDEAHKLQVVLDEGPCLDAIDGKATYWSNDVAHDDRWPLWGPAASKIGINSAIGCRLGTRTRSYGSLNVYAKRVDAFVPDDVNIVEMLAAHATAAYAAAHREVGLASALENRSIIGQAQGILMQKFDIDADTAFTFLQRISQHENVRLFAVAEAIAVQRDANARPKSD